MAHDVSPYNSKRNVNAIKIVFAIDCLACNDFKGKWHQTEIDLVLCHINPHGSLHLFRLSVNRSRSIIILIRAFYTNRWNIFIAFEKRSELVLFLGNPHALDTVQFSLVLSVLIKENFYDVLLWLVRRMLQIKINCISSTKLKWEQKSLTWMTPRGPTLILYPLIPFITHRKFAQAPSHRYNWLKCKEWQDTLS